MGNSRKGHTGQAWQQGGYWNIGLSAGIVGFEHNDDYVKYVIYVLDRISPVLYDMK
ncbi:hypothetical protein [Paenibacillus thalictri]|uniref:hypothetical protein n=1 Tax=Paenibacillus thalictri TaxID=2527873 RepID=UPI0013EF27F2|nr:hypothetical protein [Paenibacillus thalictri]